MAKCARTYTRNHGNYAKRDEQYRKHTICAALQMYTYL